MKRLIKFLQTKIGKPHRPSLTVCRQSCVSFPPKSPPGLSILVLSPNSFSPKPPSKPNFSTQSSQTFDVQAPRNPYPTAATSFPQIDGFAEESPIHYCLTVFETKSQVELHDELKPISM